MGWRRRESPSFCFHCYRDRLRYCLPLSSLPKPSPKRAPPSLRRNEIEEKRCSRRITNDLSSSLLLLPLPEKKRMKEII
ncbi:hypothetical protein Lal_00023556 [Lupinus albus]|nr:hypothetical protein Lal_00023556 [Lupinus albus]